MQRACFSGKSHQHAVKNVIIAEATEHIAYLSDTYEGSVHDKAITDESGYTFPKGSTVYQDRGFEGYTCDGVTMQQPKKKSKNGTRTPDEKLENQRISRIRVKVEHVIRSVKRYRIVSETIRIYCDEFRDKVMETCCGLHNFLNKRKR